MGRPRPPGSHCRFGQGIELVKYLDCRAIKLLCQGDHLPSARLTLGPGSFQDDAMAPTIAHLFDEYHPLKSEVLGPKGNRSRRASTAKTVLGRSGVLELHSAALPCSSLDDARRRPTTPYDCTLRIKSYTRPQRKTCETSRLLAGYATRVVH
jgi:hypothetical protein